MAVLKLADVLGITNRHTPAGLATKTEAQNTQLLANALAKMNQQRAANQGAFAVAEQKGADDLFQRGVTSNLPISMDQARSRTLSPDVLGELAKRSALDKAKTGAGILDTATSGGGRPNVPKKTPISLSDLADIDYTVNNPFKGVEAAEAAAKVRLEESEVIDDYVNLATGKNVGTIGGRKRSRSVTTEAKQKGTPIASALFDKLLAEGTIIDAPNPAYPGFYLIANGKGKLVTRGE